MKMHPCLKAFVTTSFLLCAQRAWALDGIDARVTVLEATYMPNRITFTINVAIPGCAVGTWLSWQNADPSNNRIVYATLLTALTAKKLVRLYMKNGCELGYIHLLEQDAT
jgi:hypothetical protein